MEVGVVYTTVPGATESRDLPALSGERHVSYSYI
jgi:hypothetical protein